VTNQTIISPNDPSPTLWLDAHPRLGTAITTLVVLFLLFDSVTKIILVPPVVQACAKMGISRDVVFSIGVLLLVCTVIHVIPRCAIIGAILLTAYLGGATALHVISKSGAFPTIFSIAFGLLVWLGLVRREPAVLRWVLHRV
jgi:hypothetical protein